jgi:hypothetical protein
MIERVHGIESILPLPLPCPRLGCGMPQPVHSDPWEGNSRRHESPRGFCAATLAAEGARTLRQEMQQSKRNMSSTAVNLSLIKGIRVGARQ